MSLIWRHTGGQPPSSSNVWTAACNLVVVSCVSTKGQRIDDENGVADIFRTAIKLGGGEVPAKEELRIYFRERWRLSKRVADRLTDFFTAVVRSAQTPNDSAIECAILSMAWLVPEA